MLQPRWRQIISSLALWLPLPLLGLIFWVVGGQLTQQVLSRAYNSGAHLRASRQPKLKPITVPSTVLAIKVVIHKRQRFSEVRVKPINSTLKELIFEFPVAEFPQLEVAIARELGLSPEAIRKSVHYQIEN